MTDRAVRYAPTPGAVYSEGSLLATEVSRKAFRLTRLISVTVRGPSSELTIDGRNRWDELRLPAGALHPDDYRAVCAALGAEP